MSGLFLGDEFSERSVVLGDEQSELGWYNHHAGLISMSRVLLKAAREPFSPLLGLLSPK